MEPVPLGNGLRIWFTPDGEPAHKGISETEVQGRVESWLRRNETHPQVRDVERWLDQFNLRKVEEREAANINALVDKVLKRSTLSPELKKLVRQVAFTARGKTPPD